MPTDHGYIFTFNGHGQFAPDGKVGAPVNVDAHNRAVEAEELTYWATAPDRFHGYYTLISRFAGQVHQYAQLEHLRGDTVRIDTWLGTPIAHGRITSAHVNNLGARMLRLRVRGTNGREYWGAAGYDAQLVTLHGCKPRTRATKTERS